MAQYLLPKTERTKVLDVFDQFAGISIRTMDTAPLVDDDGGSWMRYECDRGNARALIALSDHQHLTDELLVTVSTDLRRLLRITRIWGDVQLVREIGAEIHGIGGKLLVD
jgi:hypothetical protein